MTGNAYNSVIFTMCQNIYCEKPLTDFEMDRQLIGKKLKYRFCWHCRKQYRAPRNHPVEWRCWRCGLNMGDSHLAKLICNDCHNTRRPVRGTVTVVDKPNALKVSMDKRIVSIFPPKEFQ